MPEFHVVDRQETMRSSASGRRSQIIEEYARYIQGLGPDMAGSPDTSGRRNGCHSATSPWLGRKGIR